MVVAHDSIKFLKLSKDALCEQLVHHFDCKRVWLEGDVGGETKVQTLNKHIIIVFKTYELCLLVHCTRRLLQVYLYILVLSKRLNAPIFNLTYTYSCIGRMQVINGSILRRVTFDIFTLKG